MHLRRYPDSRQRGVALAIVLWFLAAMSLLVGGIVYQGRVDVQLAQAHVARAKAIAAGDGAIHMMVARFMSAPVDGVESSGSENGGQPGLKGRFVLGDSSVAVEMVPASGLIDVFNSPPRILAALIAHRTGLSAERSKQLADNVVELRSPLARRSRRQQSGEGATSRLSTPEDLLRVPGFSRAMLDAVADDIRAVRGGRDELNWAAAPDGLIEALRGSDPQRAATLLDRRGGSGGNRLWNARAEDLFRVDAVVNYGGQQWLRRRWVQLSPGKDSELPWRIMRTEAPRALAKFTSSGGG